MATYAIGDVQGCYGNLRQLIAKIQFRPSQDQLWFVGDLVNRGPHSLPVLRYLIDLGPAARVVLGNHDLFLLAVAEGIASLRPHDSIQDVLQAEDRKDLLLWLRQQPLCRREDRYFMVHAGLLPQWTVQEASELAEEAARALAGPQYGKLLHTLFHEAPTQWSPSLTGIHRWASVTRVLTRIRTCTVNGHMATTFSGPPGTAPAGQLPWFQIAGRQSAEATVICGHWAALGLYMTQNIVALDSGCVWGGRLTAVRLEDRHVFQVSCEKARLQ